MNIFRDIYSIIIVRLCVFGLGIGVLVPSEAQALYNDLNVLQSDCSTAIDLSCSSGSLNVTYSLSSNVGLPLSSCVSDISPDLIRDVWFSFDASGESGYYLDAINANIGINIFSGTCDGLLFYDCAESYDSEGSYWVNSLLPEGTYLIQVINLTEDEDLETQINFGCFDDPSGDCSVGIDFVNVSECLNELGYADLAIGGSTNKDYVSLELLLDDQLLFFDCLVDNGFWVSNFQLQGETIHYISIYAGNSATGCSDEIYEEIDLPLVNCNPDDPHLLKFLDSSTPFCSPSSAQIRMYQSGTETLKHFFTVQYDELKNAYVILDPPLGTFDIFIKPLGSLQQSFGNIEIMIGTQTVMMDAIQKGDLNNSNSINIADISILSSAFNSTEGDVNYNPLADFDCSTSINIADISIFGLNFNEVGDGPPLLEP